MRKWRSMSLTPKLAVCFIAYVVVGFPAVLFGGGAILEAAAYPLPHSQENRLPWRPISSYLWRQSSFSLLLSSSWGFETGVSRVNIKRQPLRRPCADPHHPQ